MLFLQKRNSISWILRFRQRRCGRWRQDHNYYRISTMTTRHTEGGRSFVCHSRELLADVKTMVHFHNYLYGRQFLLQTEYFALKWWLKSRRTSDHMIWTVAGIQLQHWTPPWKPPSLSRQLVKKTISRREHNVVDDEWPPVKLSTKQRKDRALRIRNERNPEQGQNGISLLLVCLSWRPPGHNGTPLQSTTVCWRKYWKSMLSTKETTVPTSK